MEKKKGQGDRGEGGGGLVVFLGKRAKDSSAEKGERIDKANRRMRKAQEKIVGEVGKEDSSKKLDKAGIWEAEGRGAQGIRSISGIRKENSGREGRGGVKIIFPKDQEMYIRGG